MTKKCYLCLFLFTPLFFLSGCATVYRQKDLQMQGLRNQISVLEAQLQAKDEELSSLKDGFNRLSEEKKSLECRVNKKKIVDEVKSRPSLRQIQIALKNAGYNPGQIDGRMGRQTRQAIRAFQSAHNLEVDGRPEKKTWGLLKGYLYKKVK